MSLAALAGSQGMANWLGNTSPSGNINAAPAAAGFDWNKLLGAAPGIAGLLGGMLGGEGQGAEIRQLPLLSPGQQRLMTGIEGMLANRMPQQEQFKIPGYGKVTHQYQPMPIEYPFPRIAGLSNLQQQSIQGASNVLGTAQNEMSRQRPSYTDLLSQYEPGNIGAIASQMGGGPQWDQTPYQFNEAAITGVGPDVRGAAEQALSQPPYNTWTDRKGRPVPTTGYDPYAQAMGEQDAQWNPAWGPIPKRAARSYTPPDPTQASPFYMEWLKKNHPGTYKKRFGNIPGFADGGYMHDTDYGMDLPSFADGGIMPDKDPAKDAWQIQQNLADKTHLASKAKADQEYAKTQMDAHKQYAEGGPMPSYANGGIMPSTNQGANQGTQNTQNQSDNKLMRPPGGQAAAQNPAGQWATQPWNLVGEKGPELHIGQNGQRNMIGENGPELFDPNQNGYVVPNHQLPPGMTAQNGPQDNTGREAPLPGGMGGFQMGGIPAFAGGGWLYDPQGQGYEVQDFEKKSDYLDWRGGAGADFSTAFNKPTWSQFQAYQPGEQRTDWGGADWQSGVNPLSPSGARGWYTQGTGADQWTPQGQGFQYDQPTGNWWIPGTTGRQDPRFAAGGMFDPATTGWGWQDPGEWAVPGQTSRWTPGGTGFDYTQQALGERPEYGQGGGQEAWQTDYDRWLANPANPLNAVGEPPPGIRDFYREEADTWYDVRDPSSPSYDPTLAPGYTPPAEEPPPADEPPGIYDPGEFIWDPSTASTMTGTEWWKNEYPELWAQVQASLARDTPSYVYDEDAVTAEMVRLYGDVTSKWQDIVNAPPAFTYGEQERQQDYQDWVKTIRDPRTGLWERNTAPWLEAQFGKSGNVSSSFRAQYMARQFTDLQAKLSTHLFDAYARGDQNAIDSAESQRDRAFNAEKEITAIQTYRDEAHRTGKKLEADAWDTLEAQKLKAGQMMLDAAGLPAQVGLTTAQTDKIYTDIASTTSLAKADWQKTLAGIDLTNATTDSIYDSLTSHNPLMSDKQKIENMIALAKLPEMEGNRLYWTMQSLDTMMNLYGKANNIGESERMVAQDVFNMSFQQFSDYVGSQNVTDAWSKIMDILGVQTFENLAEYPSGGGADAAGGLASLASMAMQGFGLG